MEYLQLESFFGMLLVSGDCAWGLGFVMFQLFIVFLSRIAGLQLGTEQTARRKKSGDDSRKAVASPGGIDEYSFYTPDKRGTC